MKRDRSGKTLIEMMVTMTLVSTLLLMCGRTVLTLLRAQRTSEKGVAAALLLGRLEQTFRRDVHAARRFDLDQVAAGAGDRLQLQLTGSERVEYTTAVDGIHRRVLHGTDVVARDRFAIPGGRHRIEVADKSSLIALVCVPPIPDESNAGVMPAPFKWEMRIEAVAGRDHQYVEDTEKKAVSLRTHRVPVEERFP